MTTQPGIPVPVTPPSLDPMLVMRLYDETKEMRNDVAGIRGDLRDVATMMRTTIEQGHDHEARIRTLEEQAAKTADHPARLDGHDRRLFSLEKKVWIASGAVGLVVGGASVAATLLAGAGR